MASGLGVRLFGLSWDFQTVAELGEAFGVLGAVMAGVAVYFTWEALAAQRVETGRLREREIVRDAADAQRDKELTYFRMLELRREILLDISVGAAENRGIKAFKALYNGYRPPEDKDAYRNIYLNQQRIHSNSIDHYFRFTYYIINFLDDNFSFNKAYQYIRIFRAQLSNAEQFMIALNATYGAGREKMLPLINKYGLLHNISDKDKDLFLKFNDGLEEGAFSSHSLQF